jgi:hypothetical protein
LPEGEAPPDICIEIALWDRFQGWGPEQTNRFTLTQLRVLFAVLEQQRVTKDSIENLGKPSSQKLDVMLAAKEEQRLKMQSIEDARK